MTVRRRAFIKYLGGAAVALSALRQPLLTLLRSGELPKLPGFGQRSEFRIRRNGTYLARPRGVASLPEAPNPGDHVTIVVTAESLSAPAMIRFTGESLMGLNEDLILDALAVFRLSYGGPAVGWVNGPIPAEADSHETQIS